MLLFVVNNSVDPDRVGDNESPTKDALRLARAEGEREENHCNANWILSVPI